MSSADRVTTPGISVLIPVYNVERYVGACLDSLLAQDFTNFEALVINDGSTDGSRAILEQYAARDKRIRIIDKPNSGYGISMNRGLAEARGTYIAILESDDVMAQGALRLLYETACEHNAEVVKGNFWLWWSGNEDTAERTELFHVVPENLIGKVVTPTVNGLDIFYQKPSIWSALYRADFLRQERIQFLETPGASYQDAGFNFKVWAAAQRAVFIDEPLLKYRQDNETSSVRSPGKVFCVMDEHAEMRRWLEARPGDHRMLLKVLGRMKFNNYLWNYDRLSDELRTTFLERACPDLAADRDEGLLDEQIMGPVKFTELQCLLTSPERFRRVREKLPQDASGGLASVRQILAYGGIGALWHVLAERLGGRR
ncbi:MAG TPA: glycosyltransferase [Candidatus Coprovicinus avistercoris]|uniref:Glycosyltransferase n=1 Tax=Candidatus Coprovicinus avistercoris TaxID=2840754 RepID=A0A9D1HX85_9ACTN|nr:glycosyltransferase [Candidatus Coprovicinus avistercoris]